MSTRRTILSLLLLSLLSGTGVARAESLFGMSFFGLDTSAADARIEGRGGTGLAYSDSVNASVLHPGQLADLKRVTIGVTSRFERRSAEDDNGTVARNQLATPTLRLGLPLPGRAGFGTGFAALRSTQWTVDRPFGPEPTVNERIEREGTQFVIPLQLGARFGDHLRLGVGLWARFSTIRMRYDLDLPGNDTDVSEVREDIGDGIAPELSIGLDDVGPFSATFHWVGEHEQDVDVRQRGVALSNRADAERTDTVPGRLGAGLRVDLPGQWNAGVDFEVEQWSQYEGRNFLYTGGVYDSNGSPIDLQDEFEWRLGVERESRLVGVRETTPLRLGAYWRRWHYSLGGEDVTEWGVTLGSGVALQTGRARVDAAIGYGRIGSLDENGATEDVFRLIVSISGGERWY